jgi:hypothetical protein
VTVTLGYPRRGAALSKTTPVLEITAATDLTYDEDGTSQANSVITRAGAASVLSGSSVLRSAQAAGYPLLEASISYSSVAPTTKPLAALSAYASGAIAVSAYPVTPPSVTLPLFGALSLSEIEIGMDIILRWGKQAGNQPLTAPRFPEGFEATFRIVRVDVMAGDEGVPVMVLTLNIPPSSSPTEPPVVEIEKKSGAEEKKSEEEEKEAETKKAKEEKEEAEKEGTLAEEEAEAALDEAEETKNKEAEEEAKKQLEEAEAAKKAAVEAKTRAEIEAARKKAEEQAPKSHKLHLKTRKLKEETWQKEGKEAHEKIEKGEVPVAPWEQRTILEKPITEGELREGVILSKTRNAFLTGNFSLQPSFEGASGSVGLSGLEGAVLAFSISGATPAGTYNSPFTCPVPAGKTVIAGGKHCAFVNLTFVLV